MQSHGQVKRDDKWSSVTMAMQGCHVTESKNSAALWVYLEKKNIRYRNYYRFYFVGR